MISFLIFDFESWKTHFLALLVSKKKKKNSSGRAAMVALPALGVVFLEVEWKINECAMRQRQGGKPPAVEPDDILPKRSG
jgi:hypothetical protein